MMRNPCAKGEVLLHQAGFELQADEAGQRSDIEFVTNAVDETPADAGIQHYTVNHPEAPARTAQMTGVLSAITAQNFIDLVQSIPFLPPINMATPVFEGGIYHNDPGADHTILNGLSKDVWIRGIAQGTDLLTKRNFPVRGVRDELESIGGYGNKTDVTGGAIQMPILELRSMPLTPLANGANVTDEVFRYVYNINHGYNIKYGEHPVPAPPGSI